MNTNVIASLTVTRQNGRKTIVEIHRDATFIQFYHFHSQDGLKRSTKRLVRIASRNEFLPIINAHLHKPGLDVIAKRLESFGAQSNPVINTKIQIIKKRIYRKMLSMRPDELGLTRLITTDLNLSKPIPVSVPSYYWVAQINKRKLHRGAAR